MMKNNFLSHIKAVCVCFLLMLVTNSCCSKQGGMASFNPYQVRLIKFKNPSYKDYILAYYSPKHSTNPDVANPKMVRFNMCVAHPLHFYQRKWEFAFPESHHTPYWELPDNWLLVDWRWYLFPYDWETSVIIDKNWDELQDSDGWWSKDMILDNDPIAEWKDIPVENIERYLEKNYSVDEVSLISETRRELNFYNTIRPQKYDFCLCEIPDRMDAIWSELQADLSIVINEGNIKKMH